MGAPGHDPRFPLPRRDMIVRGVRLAIVDEGPRHPKHTMVFMHGLAGNMTHWIHIAPHFLQGRWRDQVRVVALDFRGCGASSRKGPLSIASYADDVVSLCEELQIDKACFVGHSLGGMIACAIAARSPKLCERMVLLDPGGLRHVPAPLQLLGEALLSETLLAATLPKVWMRVLSLVFERHNQHTEAFVRYTEESFPKQARAKDVGDVARVIAALRHDFLHSDLTPTLQSFLGPVGLLYGERDRLVPAKTMRELAKAQPNLILEAISDCGHMPNIEAPERVISFIEQIVAPS